MNQQKTKRIPSKAKKIQAQDYLQKNPLCPIVGIGASAGGLEAIEKFYSKMPPQSGVAIVVISHLDPTHTSMLPQLISKFTKMDVVTIKQNVKVKPNTTYVIPPSKYVVLQKGALRLINSNESLHVNKPIDVFFTSLGEEAGENAVGIILSGTGADGSIGLKTIKALGGLVIAQDPTTAKFEGMPECAINTGLVDYILSPEKIPEQLHKWHHFGIIKDKKISKDLKNIFSLLKFQTGHDFSSYKLNTIIRRIERQMFLHHIDKLADYVAFLRARPAEINNLLKDLLIGVTHFFRDPEAFEILKQDIIPKLLKGKSEDYLLRIWVPGCSTGEEVYSIAMIIIECMTKLKKFCHVQIFGTDIDLVALEYARTGIYPANKMSDVSAERLNKFFIHDRYSYKIGKEIRKMVIFGVQNVIKDPPFTKLDMICCRNLLIYLNANLQQKLFPIFHYSLKTRGILFLGTSESVSDSTDLFQLIARKWKIYERIDKAYIPPALLEFPTTSPFANNANLLPSVSYTPQLADEKNDKNITIKSYLLNNYAPPCLVIDQKGEIIYTYSNLHPFIDNVLRDKRNFLKAMPISLRKRIQTTLKITHSHRKAKIIKKCVIQDADKKFHGNIRVIPVFDSEALVGKYIIIFEEIFSLAEKKKMKIRYNTVAKMSNKIFELERDLRFTKETLQTTIEELQSNIEELQSTNEELQSTNEEIETSKEELQSLNEELVIANTELQTQIDQMATVNDDMNNLFMSTEVSAIFLDSHLRIKLYTPKVEELIHLLRTDIGRPLNHFATDIKYEGLIDDAKDVIKNLVPKSFEVQSKRDNWYVVRMSPYRTAANIIDGVIITFNDITEKKDLEKKMQAMQSQV